MNSLISILFLFWSISLLGQSLRPAISYTFKTEANQDVQGILYKEGTLNFNILYNIGKTHNLGLQYLSIHTKGSAYKMSEERNSYFLAGIFYQYDLLKESKSELFPEFSLNYGNYCTCGQLDPFEKNGIVYFGYGFGYDIYLDKHIFLDLGIHFYRPVTKIKNENDFYANGQYIFGISYLIE